MPIRSSSSRKPLRVRSHLGERVNWADQFVDPVPASRKIAQALGIETRRPILQMRRIYYTADGRPVEVALVRYHPDRYSFSALLLAKP